MRRRWRRRGMRKGGHLINQMINEAWRDIMKISASVLNANSTNVA